MTAALDPSRLSSRSTSRFLALSVIAVACAASASATDRPDAKAVAKAAAEPILETLSKLDTEVFEAFNTCSAPDQLQKHANYFATDVEFYHDTGGVTWSRQEMLANTAKYVCGKFRRELIPGSLKVFPVKDFGAIAQGSHRFCKLDADQKVGACDGLADFTMVWRKQNDQWQITRVLSFGHRAAPS